MLRLIAVFILSLALLVPANAETYNDPKGRFSVTRPDGWSEDRLVIAGSGTFAFSHQKSDAAPFDSSCLGYYEETPETRSRSQQEINDKFEGRLTLDFWREVIKSTVSDADITMTVSEVWSRNASGRAIHGAIFTATGTENGKTVSAKLKMEMHFVPGSVHIAQCMALDEDFAAADKDLETIFTSYTPIPSAMVSGVERPAPSVLTMYAAPRLKGAARVLSQNTADLVAAGWPTTSASLAVDGSEPWQICAGPNYSGRCEVVLTAEAGATGRPIVVRSARRLSGPEIATVTATALRRMMGHGASRKLIGRGSQPN